MSGEETKDGICIRQTNDGTAPFSCSDANPCVYVNADKSKTTDSNACACSKGNSGNQYCPLANGMQGYQDYVTALKAYVKSTADKKCHTLDIKLPHVERR
jgi:hypothetical protein